MKITVDKTKCIGCGACAAACPECFEIRDGVSFVKVTNCKCRDCETTEVAEACPAGAITVEE